MDDDFLDKEDWYEKTKSHWANSDTSLEGVLGGNAHVHDIDIESSKELLDKLEKKKLITTGSVLDCGAGIGRVTNSLLQYYFDSIDIVEQDEKFVEFCKEAFKNNTKVKNIYRSSLQDFIFQRKYNVIWIQWCLENLDDSDLITFLGRCRDNLEVDGRIFIKENIVDKGAICFEEDSSRVRSDIMFKDFFLKSGLKILKHMHHPNWPKDLLNVSIFLLAANI
jgi:protein N-terminal methyltransferase